MHAICSLNRNLGLHLGIFKSIDKITHTKMGPLLGAFKKLLLIDRAFTLSEPGEMKEDRFTSKVKISMLRRNSGNPCPGPLVPVSEYNGHLYYSTELSPYNSIFAFVHGKDPQSSMSSCRSL